jgi:hypothetical protein
MDVNVEIQSNKVDVNQLPIYTGLIGGAPKVGKSTIASKWSDRGKDGVLLIDIDMGASLINCNHLPTPYLNPPVREVKTDKGTRKEVIPPIERGYVYKAGKKKGQPMPVYSLYEIYSFIQDRLTSNDFSYETVVIDTVDALNHLVEQKVMQELGIDAMGSTGYGQDWNRAKTKNLEILGRFINLLERNAVNTLLICHTKQRKITSDNTVQESLALPSGLSKMLEGKMTWICNVKRDKEGKPIADFKAYSEKQVGSRIKALNNTTIPFSYENFKTTIKNFKED